MSSFQFQVLFLENVNYELVSFNKSIKINVIIYHQIFPIIFHFQKKVIFFSTCLSIIEFLWTFQEEDGA
jgi:hypothetical protein